MAMELGIRSKCLCFSILVFIILHTAAADDGLGLCKVMNCGKGTCSNTSSSGQLLGFIPVCECDPGWKQPSIGVSLSFLPCVIPNCTIKMECGGKAAPSAPSPVNPPSSNSSADLLNPCKSGISVCGKGSCVVESAFGYRCHCNEGYANLFNMTAGPCLRSCSIGADCSQLGLGLGGNGSETAAPQSQTAGTQTDTSKGFVEDIPILITMAIALTVPFFLFLLG